MTLAFPLSRSGQDHVTTTAAARPPSVQKPAPSPAGADAKPVPPEVRTVLDAAQQVSNKQLLLWMFRFLRPVTWYAVICCAYLALSVGTEVLAVRQSGE